MRGLQARIGRRGAILLCASWIIGWLGVMLLAGVRDLPPAAEFLSTSTWGVVWTTVATVGVVSAGAKQDAWGFSTAAGLLGLWVVLWFLSWLSSGEPRAWMWAVVWVGGLGIMLICAGWREE